jgi:hypothetical protein
LFLGRPYSLLARHSYWLPSWLLPVLSWRSTFEIRHNHSRPGFNSDGVQFITQSNRSINPFRSHFWHQVSRVRVSLDGVLDWILDLLTTLTHNSYLHLIIAPSLISTLYKSLENTLSPFPACSDSLVVAW